MKHMTKWITLTILAGLAMGRASGQVEKVLTKVPWPGAYPTPTSLRGLKSVALRVYSDHGIPSLRTRGSVRDEAEKLIRGRVMTQGIAVVGEEEAAAVLAVSMYNVCESDRLSCGYHTEFSLWQWVRLSRNPAVQVAAITWHNGYSNAMSKSELEALPDLLMVDVRSLLEGFMRQYRESNPR